MSWWVTFLNDNLVIVYRYRVTTDTASLASWHCCWIPTGAGLMRQAPIASCYRRPRWNRCWFWVHARFHLQRPKRVQRLADDHSNSIESPHWWRDAWLAEQPLVFLELPIAFVCLWVSCLVGGQVPVPTADYVSVELSVLQVRSLKCKYLSFQALEIGLKATTKNQASEAKM